MLLSGYVKYAKDVRKEAIRTALVKVAVQASGKAPFDPALLRNININDLPFDLPSSSSRHAWGVAGSSNAKSLDLQAMALRELRRRGGPIVWLNALPDTSNPISNPTAKLTEAAKKPMYGGRMVGKSLGPARLLGLGAGAGIGIGVGSLVGRWFARGSTVPVNLPSFHTTGLGTLGPKLLLGGGAVLGAGLGAVAGDRKDAIRNALLGMILGGVLGYGAGRLM